MRADRASGAPASERKSAGQEEETEVVACCEIQYMYCKKQIMSSMVARRAPVYVAEGSPLKAEESTRGGETDRLTIHHQATSQGVDALEQCGTALAGASAAQRHICGYSG